MRFAVRPKPSFHLSLSTYVVRIRPLVNHSYCGGYQHMFNEDFRVDYVCADLTAMDTEGLVINTNVQLDLNYGLGKAIRRKAGEGLKNELDRIHKEEFGGQNVLLGTTVSTPAFLMPKPIKRLIFTVWWAWDNEYDANLIFNCVTRSIRQADHHGLSSLSFPLFGRGHRLPYHVIAEGFANAVNELHTLKRQFPITRLCLVSTNQEDLNGVQFELDDRIEF